MNNNNMTFKQIWRWWTWLSLVLGIIFFVYQTKKLPSCEEYYEQEKEISYNGVITDKFIDKRNHNYHIIKIDEEGKIIDYNLSSDLSGLFKFLEVGDQVIKKKGTNNIIILRNGEKTLFMLDYGCD